MKWYSKLFLLVLFCLCLMPINTKAIDNGYYINDYHVDVVVNENNIYDVTETIVVNFVSLRHGIIRAIPLVEYGSNKKYFNKMKVISINQPYSVSLYGDNYEIKIGDTSNYVDGLVTYKIHYTYDIGNDRNKDNDEFYFDLIGNDWDTYILKSSFSITLPDNANPSLVYFYSGNYGSIKGINYEVNNNIITATYNETLNPGEGITTKVILPEGFYHKKSFLNVYKLLYLLIPILCLLIAYLYYKANDKDIIETVEFYPPNDLNSLDVGLIYNGKVGDKEVTSLLIYLAHKGYIKIKDFDNPSGNLYNITLVKRYDGDDVNLKKFMDGLFEYRIKNNATDKDGVVKVTNIELETKFYPYRNFIVSNSNSNSYKEKYFDISGKHFLVFNILLMVSLFFMLFMAGWEFNLLTIKSIISYFILLTFLYVMFSSIKSYHSIPILVLFMIIFIIMVPLLGNISFDSNIIVIFYIKYYLWIGILNIIFSILIVILSIRYKKRTEVGKTLYGRIKGFRHFLVIASKKELEALVNKNPEYFYEILPYAYVLGVSSEWISKFNSINMVSPSWYSCTNEFDLNHFNSTFDTKMRSFNKMVTSTPHVESSGSYSSSSSSSGFSGGGFSGGGSGGGGGRSW